ncbi:uncharacterized protein TRIADDRAFT_53298 [Trichoplax adhaerens]|uniref:Uncharacterized protein n=1 Tax=Trichoplax adhaerens TaxID=10228 RepID=B3RNV0_TRIAD|nr:hypothetical protein TRIADDRAFT_53298 [Trichoplax adhaerens]EDV28076.1 hypothetical protein TRIADDRAFT_53298 [Trichoplax adhaerens]|eukprot:XP_002109910.1 hypothetical protein TRIADDRAFT_53298 [Trichoplax adhaerens]
MAKSRITPEKYSGTTQVEHFGKLLNELSKLGTVISTSFGPLGRLKFLQTSQGGHVTVTSSSKRILNQLPPGHPVMHIIISAVREHLARFDDGGLFLIQLTINLITSASRLSIPNHSIIACYEFILKCCIDFFQSDTCPCRINVDISSIKTMLAFMKSILCTKPTCTLNDSEISHLSLLLIKGFVNAIPSPTSQEQFSLQECIQFIHCYGESASESKLLDGILIDNSFTLRNDRDSYANKFQFLRLPDNTIRVILFNISLAGDPEDSLPENITLIATKDDRSLKLSSIAMERFRRLIEILKANHVGFVGCQKCVHPTFKLALETNGIFVCDRLSILNIGKLLKSDTLKVQWKKYFNYRYHLEG